MVVLDSVLGPHGVELTRYLGPFPADLSDGFHENDGFFNFPGTLVELRVQVVDPFLSVLFEEAEEAAFRALEHFVGDDFPLTGFFLSSSVRKLPD